MLTIFFPVQVLIAITADAQVMIPNPVPGMSTVYFVRPSNSGLLINFSYFDSTKLIGRAPGPSYIRYDCNPGHHLFWARSENRDYVEADLEVGQVYFIYADVAMGAVKAQVDLIPIDPPNDSKRMKKVMKLMKKQSAVKFTEEELQQDAAELSKAMERGMRTYGEEEEKQVSHDVLRSDMYYVR